MNTTQKNYNMHMKLLQFPPLLMALLLQIVPLCRTAVVNPGILQSSFSIIFKWVATAGMTLGAVDAVSGASVAVSGLKPYEGTTQTGPVSLTPTVAGNADNITLRIILNQLTPESELDYYDCTPLPPGLTINTSVGAGGWITPIPGETTVPGVYEVTLTAGNQLGDVQGYPPVSANATITVSGTISGPPTITTPPATQTVNAGDSATLTVVATDNGSPPLTYQWRKGGSNVGDNSATLNLNPVTADDAGSYDVIVSSSGGSITSAPPAVLTVVVPPVIQTPPTDQSVYLGGSATFTVAADGSVPMSYQWRKGGTAIDGNSSSLTITPVTADSAGTYDVVVSNQAGSTTSSPAAVLTVVSPATMQLQIPPGQSTSGSLVIEWQGLAGKSYTLQRRDDFAPDTWHDIGQTNVTLTGSVEMIDESAGNANIRFYQVVTE